MPGVAAPVGGYRRDRVTWASFGLLLGFGVLNAGLGPALPFLRRAEHIAYLPSVAHQVAFAVGGGLAGVLAARAGRPSRRTLAVRGGLAAAALAWLVLGYADRLALTVAAAFLVSLAATSALIRIWAVLADEHGPRRAVAMAEGEVAVSLGGVLAPLLVTAVAGTAAGWHAAFALGAAIVALAVGATARVPLPGQLPPAAAAARLPAGGRRVPATLVLVVAVVALEFSLSFWLASYLSDGVGLPRRTAAGLVSVLYAANLAGRLLASRLARALAADRLLAAALLLALAGVPPLLAASGIPLAVAGLALLGAGTGATFPLSQALHVAGSGRGADGAVGQVLAAAAVGELCGPVAVAGLAQPFGLRAGMAILAACAVLALAALRRAGPRPPAPPG